MCRSVEDSLANLVDLKQVFMVSGVLCRRFFSFLSRMQCVCNKNQLYLVATLLSCNLSRIKITLSSIESTSQISKKKRLIKTFVGSATAPSCRQFA
jgi:hypothetical protein